MEVLPDLAFEALAKVASPVISLRLVPVVVENPLNGKSNTVNVLLDDGNNRSLISTKLAEELELTGRQAMYNLEGIGGKRSVGKTILARIRIRSVDRTLVTTIAVKAMPNPAGNLTPIDWNELKPHWVHFKDIVFPECDTRRPVDLVLGTDYPTLMLSLEEVSGNSDLFPVARRTPLGWTAVGPAYPGSVHRDDTELAAMFLSTSNAFLARDALKQSIGMANQAMEEWCSVKLTPNQNIYFQPGLFPDTEESWIPDWSQSWPDASANGTVSTLSKSQEDEVTTRPNPACSTVNRKPRKRTLGVTPLLLPITEKRINNCELEKLVRNFYDSEQLPGDHDARKAPSRDEILAEQGLRSSRTLLPNGHYRVSVMWKPGEPQLVSNYALAYDRLRKLENGKHLRNQKDHDDYWGIIEDWIEKKYVIPVPPGALEEKDSQHLPHFPVKRDDKTTSKVRPVLDGAAQYRGKCLNDAIHVGPKLINDLNVVLLRFRRDYVAIGGDVSEMFLQIYMEEKDQKYHRILYRRDPTQPPKHYQFQVHPFGNRGSPCVAIFVIKEHAKENASKWPRAVETVLESTLVDDNLDSVATEEEAIQLVDDLKSLYKGCGMTIRKFISNSSRVLSTLSEDERAKDIDISELKCQDSDNLPLVKTLGVVWIAAQDHFTFASQPPIVEQVWTKRLCLQTQCRLYDPLCFLAPYTIRARMEGQDYWRLNLGWDDPLPIQYQQIWKEWVKELNELPCVRIPRCLKGTNRGETVQQTLHAFCDASEKAYAAVVYVVNQKTALTNSPRESVLVIAKARVAPLNHTSIPRLELMAARLAVQLVAQVNEALHFDKSDAHYWSDSRNVIAWLRTTTKSLERYVANRVQFIQNECKLENWHWVPTLENPADVASRGMSIQELVNTQLWWKGPKFLLQDESSWPTIPDPQNLIPMEIKEEILAQELIEPNLREDQAEEGMLFYVTNSIEALDGYKLFSPRTHGTLDKLLKWCSLVGMWLARTFRKPWVQPLVTLRSDPYVREFTLLWCIKRAQRQSELLSLAVQDMRKNGKVSSKSSLLPLKPWLDGNQVLRVGARLLTAGHLLLEEKCPVLMEAKHPLTVLIARHAHEVTLQHGGGAIHTLAELNRKYCILGGRKLVQSVVRNCVICKRVNSHEVHQQMAPLPDFRIPDPAKMATPFNVCGIDCAGPFYTRQTQRKSEEKRYMLLFTCTIYRAVHIEMLYSLDAASFLMALSRFLARRPRPTTMVSDNGTNFVRADKDIQSLWKLLRQQRSDLIAKYPNIRWRFNTPVAPHTGGVFERMIRAAKTALCATVGEKHLRDEELETAFTVVEGILNSRPISYVSSETADLNAITPADFLGLRPIGPGSGTDIMPVPEEDYYRQRWHSLQKILDDFWARFVREALVKLQKMPKWHTQRPCPAVGQVVVVLESKHRGVWPLGRITEVFPSADGLVRTVKFIVQDRDYLKKQGHVHERPVHKIIPLDLERSLQEEADVDTSAKTPSGDSLPQVVEETPTVLGLSSPKDAPAFRTRSKTRP